MGQGIDAGNDSLRSSSYGIGAVGGEIMLAHHATACSDV
jgi:hypothetical protein